MRTKGVVRRTDTMGRIAIPEDICRELNITESEPFEVYAEGDDKIILKKISRGTEQDWEKAKRILLPILTEFAIFDKNGNTKKATGTILFENLDEISKFTDLVVYPVKECGLTLAYLAVKKDCSAERLEIAKEVLWEFLSENVFSA